MKNFKVQRQYDFITTIVSFFSRFSPRKVKNDDGSKIVQMENSRKKMKSPTSKTGKRLVELQYQIECANIGLYLLTLKTTQDEQEDINT